MTQLPEPVDILTLTYIEGQPVKVRPVRAHLGVDAIRALIRDGSVTGLHVIDDFPPFICDSCEYAKTTRNSKRTNGATSTSIG